MDDRTLVIAAVALVTLLAGIGLAQQPPIPDAGGVAERDGYPWRPKGPVAVIGNERGRKWDLAGRGLDVPPDGKQLAAGGWSGAIYLWNADATADRWR